MIITLYDILEKAGSVENRQKIIKDILNTWQDDITKIIGSDSVLLEKTKYASWESTIIPFEIGRKYHLDEPYDSKPNLKIFVMAFYKQKDDVKVIALDKTEGLFCCFRDSLYHLTAKEIEK